MNLYRRIRDIGPRGLVLGGLELCRNAILQHRYRFRSWHVSGTYHLKPYKSRVREVVQTLSPETVVEVGCGLGDILGGITAQTRLGIDRDEGVIEAARALYPDIHFRVGRLQTVNEILVAEGITSIDALVMVNWPHLLDMIDIVTSVQNVIKHVTVSYLIIDIIRPEVLGYAHHHSVADLGSLGTVVQVQLAIDRERDLVVIRLHGERGSESQSPATAQVPASRRHARLAIQRDE